MLAEYEIRRIVDATICLAERHIWEILFVAWAWDKEGESLLWFVFPSDEVCKMSKHLIEPEHLILKFRRYFYEKNIGIRVGYDYDGLLAHDEYVVIWRGLIDEQGDCTAN